LALGTPALLGTPGNGTTAASTSGTPPANCRMFCWVACKSVAGTRAAAPTDTLSGVWTAVPSGRADGAGGSPIIRGDWYYQDVGGSPAAVTVSTSGGTTATHIAVVCVTGAQGGTDFSNFAVGVDTTAGDPSATLPNTLTAGSVLLSIAAAHLTNSWTFPSGFTNLTNSTQGSNFRLGIGYNTSLASQTAAWTSSNTNSVASVLEVKLPVSGPANVQGDMMMVFD
jgi:hypothetical protein